MIGEVRELRAELAEWKPPPIEGREPTRIEKLTLQELRDECVEQEKVVAQQKGQIEAARQLAAETQMKLKQVEQNAQESARRRSHPSGCLHLGSAPAPQPRGDGLWRRASGGEVGWATEAGAGRRTRRRAGRTRFEGSVASRGRASVRYHSFGAVLGSCFRPTRGRSASRRSRRRRPA